MRKSYMLAYFCRDTAQDSEMRGNSVFRRHVTILKMGGPIQSAEGGIFGCKGENSGTV
jgi:hypothetical protein